ncbi:MAG: hypothetical protein WC461_01710 [Candidatus Paceibacterota bacterium]
MKTLMGLANMGGPESADDIFQKLMEMRRPSEMSGMVLDFTAVDKKTGERKPIPLILAEAEINGMKVKIDMLGTLLSWYEEILTQTEKRLADFEKDAEERIAETEELIKRLREEIQQSDEKAEMFEQNNNRLVEQKEKLGKAVEKLSRKSAKRKEIILRFIAARKKMESEIANLPKRPTRTDLQNTILAIQKILAQPIADDPDADLSEKTE